jgi:hypothetical protein
LESNSKIINKYIPFIEMELLKECGEIDNVNFPNEYKGNIIESIVSMDDLYDIFNDAVNNIYSSNNKDDINNIIESYINSIKESKEFIYDEVNAVLEKEPWTPTENDIEFIHNFCEADNIIYTINNSLCNSIKFIESCRENIYNDRNIINVFSESVSEDNTTKYYGLYEIASLTSKEVLNRVNIYKDLIVREISDIRKAIILGGRIATDILSETNTINDLEMYAISESSDLYVFNYFS